MRDNDMEKRFVQMEICFALGKNGGYMPGSLGSRSISVGRQWDENFYDSTTLIQ